MAEVKLFEVNLNETINNIKRLEEELKAIKKVYKEAAIGSEEFVKAQSAGKELTAEIKKQNDALKANTNAGDQTVNVDGNVSLLGGTFYLNGPTSTSGGDAFLVARGSSVTISENVSFTGGNLVGASGFYFNRNVEQTLTIP